MADSKKTKKRLVLRTAATDQPQEVICRNADCGAKIPGHVRSCVVCGEDAGFPNVRAAQDPKEKAALAARYQAAQADARSRGCADRLEEFRQAANQASAVLCRPIGKVAELVNSDNELYTTFYQLVEAWARLPEDNEWDKARGSVDAILFPHYHSEISFAALSIDGRGVTGYGALALVLSDVAIRLRSTVFEKNSIQFCREHQVVAGDPAPAGYRAEWRERGTLAAAKLYATITSATTEDQFAGILMDESGGTTADFVEVHIYGPLHRRAITRVAGTKPQRRADQVLLRSVKAKLDEIGVPFEELP